MYCSRGRALKPSFTDVTPVLSKRERGDRDGRRAGDDCFQSYVLFCESIILLALYRLHEGSTGRLLVYWRLHTLTFTYTTDSQNSDLNSTKPLWKTYKNMADKDDKPHLVVCFSATCFNKALVKCSIRS